MTDKIVKVEHDEVYKKDLALGTAFFATIATAALVYALGFPRMGLKRIQSAEYLTPDHMKSRRMYGICARVSDSDGVRIIHSTWRMFLSGEDRKLAKELSTKKKGDLMREQTISIRLAGVDSPEGASFGMVCLLYELGTDFIDKTTFA
jgi:endonuclease YncB( thermonuclease family)